MVQEHLITFGPFHLETIRGRLCRGEQAIPLRQRSLATLQYLAERPGRLVTKDELRQHIWAGSHVTDTVLRVCIREIRAALGDVAETPQYLQTVKGQGYQFCPQETDNITPPVDTEPIIVGRQREIDTLEEWLQRADRGDRQLVFLSGEAGVGKTTVLDLWLSRLAAGRDTVWVGQGLCTEHYGEAEPYLPLLDALGGLAYKSQGSELLAILRRYAPMWLMQLPGLVSNTELEHIQHQVQGAMQTRMIRELAKALDVLTTDRTLVLMLEDLHWCDSATIECLTFLMQRREPSRLLVLGTYRPEEAVIHAHPLRGMVQELLGRGQCVELALELLPAEDVAAYVAGRLGGPVTAELSVFIHERTEGNALFMVDMVQHLVQHGLIRRQAGQWVLRDGAEDSLRGAPEGVRQLLMRRVEELQPVTRRVLEAASVAGMAFAAATVAAGAECPVQEVEMICEELAVQQRLLDDAGLTVWPDGTSSGNYRFRHALYPQVLYEQLGSVRRMQLHRRLGVYLEAVYSDRAGEIAVQLAIHFERGGEAMRAIPYIQQISDHDVRRNAHHEAIVILRKGWALLATLPDSPERTQHELALLLILGQRLMAVKGHGAAEVGEVYSRAYALSQQAVELQQQFQALQGLYRFHLVQAQLRTADELSQRLFRLASHQHNMPLTLECYIDLGLLAFYRSDPVAARAHLEQSLRLNGTQPSPSPLFSGGHEARVTTLLFLAMTLGMLGYADQARKRCQEALTRAQQLEHTPSLMWAQLFTTIFAQQQQDVTATQAYAEELVALATDQGFERHVEYGRILRGWTLAMRGDAIAGVAHIQQGLAAVQHTGLKLYRPYFLALLAEAYGQAGQPDAGLSTLDEALTLVTSTEERWWESELYRLKGELLLLLPCPDISQATSCFHQAIERARSPQARSLELRAVLSLSRLWQHQGQRDQARQLLTEVYSWFTEGFSTPDLQAAQTRLAV